MRSLPRVAGDAEWLASPIHIPRRVVIERNQPLNASSHSQSPPTARRRLSALRARRTLHMMRTDVVSFSTTHKTVTELQIVDGVLRKQVPTIILFVLGATL